MMLKCDVEYCGRPLLLDRVCSGYTPLIFAACNGCLDVCRLLVEHKADLTVKNKCLQTTLPLLMRVDLTSCAAALVLPCETPSY